MVIFHNFRRQSVSDHCRGRISPGTAQKVVFEFRNSELNSDHAVGFVIAFRMNNETYIRGYHFTMSPLGAWVIEGDLYTYTGHCGLEVEMICHGSRMRFPHSDAFMGVSFTLPRRRSLSPEMGHQARTIRRLDGAGPSTSRRTWQDTRDAPPSRRALRRSMPKGSSGSRRNLLHPPSFSSEQMEEEEEAEVSDGVEELVNVEISMEVIEISSDSETEDDPSEGSSIPGIF
ncbi:unnamed protein product [Lupinus luteus]|uniref:Uncharacterized protein n=1 Tax=Lupinus luteus TaxID=3873 RepID=A0AAV1WSN8_LUPLU